MNDTSNKAIILLNFGGPASIPDVADFLFEILRDPNVIQLPFPLKVQDAIARRIANRRKTEVEEQYEELGGGSPIIKATEAQRLAVETWLAKHDQPLPVTVAHRYIPGHTAACAQQLVAEGKDDLLFLPMYPHYSHTTTGSSVEQMIAELEKAGFEGRYQILRSYCNDPRYLDAMAETIRGTLEKEQLSPEGTLLLCSAHGLPKAYVTKGDPYQLELLLTLEGLRTRLPEWEFFLSFQSKVGPAEWLKPYTDELIPELPERGVRQLVFVPISFVNDHLETLFEVQETYFGDARNAGLTPYCVPAIETHPQFIELLGNTALEWSNGRQGLDTRWASPPSQQFRRYDQWLLMIWLTALLIAIHAAL